MLNEAIKKIKDEMDKNNNPYVKVVGEFLLQHLEINPGAAEKILDKEKSIIKSLDEMKKAAEKKKVGNCAVLTDKEGFEIVLKYFGIKEKVTVLPTDPSCVKVNQDPIVNSKNSIDFDVNLEDFLL